MTGHLIRKYHVKLRGSLLFYQISNGFGFLVPRYGLCLVDPLWKLGPSHQIVWNWVRRNFLWVRKTKISPRSFRIRTRWCESTSLPRETGEKLRWPTLRVPSPVTAGPIDGVVGPWKSSYLRKSKTPGDVTSTQEIRLWSEHERSENGLNSLFRLK